MDLSEKQLCRDWLDEFPLLRRYKGGRRLLRIYDPVVYGLELRKINTVYRPSYRPEFTAACLLTHWNGFGINEGARDSRNLLFDIEHEDHAERFTEALEAVRARFPILSLAAAEEQDMVDLYRRAIGHQMERGENPLSNWGALLQMLKYYGRAEEHAAEKRKLLAAAAGMPLVGLHPSKSVAEYEQYVEAVVDPPIEVLIARRAARLAKAGWDRLPGVSHALNPDAREGEWGMGGV